MMQDEIFNITTDIILFYSKIKGISYFKISSAVLNILNKRGIHRGKPMYATARLMVLRDLLQVWEAQ